MLNILKIAKSSKIALAVIASVTIFASVYGFAATLGVSTSGLGADTKVVASCGTGMSFAYTTSYYSGIPGYAVNGINLTNIPSGCLGKSLSVTFYNGNNSNASVGTAVTATLPATGTTQTVSVTPSANTIDASLVTGVSVVVS
jgi:hypothetical protein